MTDDNPKLYSYQNGNYTVDIYQDGTKVRTSPDGTFNAEYPESIDLKITNRCSFGEKKDGVVTSKVCGFCHEQSHNRGKEASNEALTTLLDYFDDAPNGMEIAIGGGNALSHPQIEWFVTEANKRGVIANLTHNQLHLEQDSAMLNRLMSNKLIYGLGISYRGFVTNHLISISKFNGFVLHVIAGVDNIDDVLKAVKQLTTKKVLILGYKEFGNGVGYMSDEVKKRKREWFNKLPAFVKEILDMGGNVMFDNLANEQLNVKRLFIHAEDYDTYFNGEDGTHTFYIDASTEMYGKNSCAPVEERKSIFRTSLKEMLNNIK
jgi:hypothetical protein